MLLFSTNEFTFQIKYTINKCQRLNAIATVSENTKKASNIRNYNACKLTNRSQNNVISVDVSSFCDSNFHNFSRNSRNSRANVVTDGDDNNALASASWARTQNTHLLR